MHLIARSWMEPGWEGRAFGARLLMRRAHGLPGNVGVGLRMVECVAGVGGWNRELERHAASLLDD